MDMGIMAVGKGNNCCHQWVVWFGKRHEVFGIRGQRWGGTGEGGRGVKLFCVNMCGRETKDEVVASLESKRDTITYILCLRYIHIYIHIYSSDDIGQKRAPLKILNNKNKR